MELSKEILLLSLVSVYCSLFRLLILFICLYFCFNLLDSSAWLIYISFYFQFRVCLYCYITTFNNYIYSRYLLISLLTFFTYLSFYLLANFTDYSARITFEWQANYISFNFCQSSVRRYYCYVMTLTWLAMIEHFYFNQYYAVSALICHYLICSQYLLASYWFLAINSLCANQTCFLMYYSSALYLLSRSKNLIFSLFIYYFWPVIRNFWSFIMSSHRATFYLKDQFYKAFSLTTLFWRSTLVLLKWRLIYILEAYNLALSAIDQVIFPFTCSSDIYFSQSFSRRLIVLFSAYAIDIFYFSQQTQAWILFQLSDCKDSQRIKLILNFQFSSFKYDASRIFDLDILSSFQLLAQLSSWLRRSIYSVSNSIFQSRGYYLDQMCVLSSFFSRDLLRRQIVGPYEPFYFCLCSRPEMGERLIDRLTEYETIQSENALLLFIEVISFNYFMHSINKYWSMYFEQLIACKRLSR